jgi:amino acid adenylation domain-containing protein
MEGIGRHENSPDDRLGFWERELAGVLWQSHLPTDRPLSTPRSYVAAQVHLDVPRALATHLSGMARDRCVTLESVFLAAWAILLARLGGQSDLIIGVTAGTSPLAEVDAVRGLLPVRLDCRLDVSLGPFLDRVHKTFLAAHAHYVGPFSVIAERLKLAPIPGREGPIRAGFEFSEGSSRSVAPSSTKTTFDVSLLVRATYDVADAWLTFSTDLFERETVERWTGYLEVLLREMVDAREKRLTSLALLDSADLRLLLETFNPAPESYPRGKCVHELFEAQVSLSPDVIAVTYFDQQLTYAELDRRADFLALWLLEKGIGPDHRVGVCLPRGIDVVVSILAILKAGGAYVPIDPAYPTDRLKYMLDNAVPEVLLTHSALTATIPETGALVVALDLQWSEIYSREKSRCARRSSEISPRNLAFVIYTSGSTGEPKGIAMEHRPLVNLIEWHRRSPEFSRPQRTLQFAALGFDVAFQEMFATLCVGGTLLLIHENMRQSPQSLCQFILDKGVERLFIPPVMLHTLADYAEGSKTRFPALRDVITAGEQLRITPSVRWLFEGARSCRLHNHYGPTESHVVTACTLPLNVGEWPDLPSIGRPISNARIYILDSEGKPVPIGVIGEIFIGGVGVARGYLNRENLTADRFLPDPFSDAPNARMYKTGDLGRWLPDATIEYLGRNDSQVKISGFRVELGEVEAALQRQPEVKQAVVVASNGESGGRRLVAYVVADQDHLGGPQQELIAQLRTNLLKILPPYMVPTAMVVLDELPLTPNGKVNRQSLPVPDGRQQLRQPQLAPSTVTEEVLAGIWEGVLGLDRVGTRDNFFELGGTSLQGMRLVLKASGAFTVNLPGVTIFQYPTIRELAGVIDEARLDTSRARFPSGLDLEEGVI